MLNHEPTRSKIFVASTQVITASDAVPGNSPQRTVRGRRCSAMNTPSETLFQKRGFVTSPWADVFPLHVADDGPRCLNWSPEWRCKAMIYPAANELLRKQQPGGRFRGGSDADDEINDTRDSGEPGGAHGTCAQIVANRLVTDQALEFFGLSH